MYSLAREARPLPKKWAEHFWKAQIKKAGIQRHRKFYATRHTTNTELIKAGHNLKAIADYVGTSVAMIEQNYCARLQLNAGNREVFEKLAKKLMKLWLRGRDLNPGPQGYEPCE